jgi:hypothetical protein
MLGGGPTDDEDKCVGTGKDAMTEHILKVWPEYFDAILRGDKNFEIRKDDRGFREQDVLLLREYSPGSDEYTGREITARVTYCIRGNEPMGHAFGLRTGFVAMALAVPSEDHGCK